MWVVISRNKMVFIQTIIKIKWNIVWKDCLEYWVKLILLVLSFRTWQMVILQRWKDGVVRQIFEELRLPSNKAMFNHEGMHAERITLSDAKQPLLPQLLLSLYGKKNWYQQCQCHPPRNVYSTVMIYCTLARQLEENVSWKYFRKCLPLIMRYFAKLLFCTRAIVWKWDWKFQRSHKN